MSFFPVLILIAILWILAKNFNKTTKSTAARTRPQTSVSSTPRLRGDGDYLCVVGESHYQANIAAVVGKPNDRGYDVETEAVLIFEDTNQYDPKAVMVTLEGRCVGYLPKSDAKKFRKAAARAHPGHSRFACGAVVRGGWDRGRKDKGAFGVEVELPEEYM